MSKEAIPFIILIAFLVGLNIRSRQGKKIIWYVDPILILQAISIVLLPIPNCKLYSIIILLLSMLFALVLNLLNKQKKLIDRLLLTIILFFPFITLLSKLEHWWWTIYIWHACSISAITFIILLFFFPKKIEKELSYFVIFAFNIFFGLSKLFFH